MSLGLFVAPQKSREANRDLQIQLDQVLQQAQDPNSRGNSLFAEVKTKLSYEHHTEENWLKYQNQMNAVNFKLNVRLKHSNRISETEGKMKRERCVFTNSTESRSWLAGCFNFGVFAPIFIFLFKSAAEILTYTFTISKMLSNWLKSQLPQYSQERRTPHLSKCAFYISSCRSWSKHPSCNLGEYISFMRLPEI